MSQMLLIGNPRRRRRRAKSAKRRSRRAHRKLSALQRMYFGKRRHRVTRHRRRSRRRAVIVASPNPIRRRRRGARRVRRSRGGGFRRNPIGGTQVRASLASVSNIAQRAVVGAAGAVAVDAAMGQVSRFLPASLSARLDSTGALNWGYYLTKAGVAVGIGVLGARFLPGKLKGFAARATEGSFTIMSYEIMRSMIPASLLGFYSPARTAGSVGRLGGRMGAYLRAPAVMGRLGYASGGAGAGIGGSARNFEGYAM